MADVGQSGPLSYLATMPFSGGLKCIGEAISENT
jgi:hypothetical protein